MLLRFLLLFPFLLLTACSNSKDDGINTLKISAEEDIDTFDPRQARNLSAVNATNMFFEGLLHTGKDGKPQLALAESIEISPDLKSYTFRIREAQWSNGDPVTANDFEESWKSILEPSFPSPNAYQLYVIKGAKEAKEGLLAMEEVGITAKDPRTLVVELENPVPFFDELVSSYFYLPVHSSWRENKNFANDPTQWVSNGPFILKSLSQHHEFVAEKNPNYWDKKAVSLNKIVVMKMDANTSMHMFESNELNWTGSPLNTIPTDAIVALKKEGILNSQPAAGTYWFRLNTQQPPFDNVNMRKAFAYALNRKAIIDHVTQGNQQPATGIVPPSIGIENAAFFSDNDLKSAKEYFQTGLKEMGMTSSQLPEITLMYGQNERNHKIAQAVQQQWNNAFGIQVQLQTGESKFVADKLRKLDYQIALGSWFADYGDPINFLEIFKSKSNRTNQTGWENSDYAQLLDKSGWEGNKEQRQGLLSQAEQILMQEMPVIPVFYSTFLYLKSPNLEGVYFSPLGYLDFKHAKFNP